jgi:hypothetical protein
MRGHSAEVFCQMFERFIVVLRQLVQKLFQFQHTFFRVGVSVGLYELVVQLCQKEKNIYINKI